MKHCKIKFWSYSKKAVMCLTSIIMLCSNFFFSCFTTNKINAIAYEPSKITYAKVLDGCALYKTSTMSNDISNVYFYVPSTYFVSIVSKISDDIYKVQYASYTGFCYANCLSIVSFEPTKPTLLGITFDINPTSGTQIWSTPSDSKGVKFTTISAGTGQIEYVASTIGDIPLGGTVDLWHFARYTPANNTTAVYEGYVYSEATTNLSNIPNNLEVENEPITTNTDANVSIDKSLKIVLIVLICLPFVVLFAVGIIRIIKQTKLKKKEEKESQEISVKPIKASNTFVRKPKQKIPSIAPEQDESIEVVFPEYDYIDDDDLL